MLSNYQENQPLGLVALSGAISDKDWQLCLDFFKKEQVQIIYSSLINKKDNFFSGTPEQKLQQLLFLINKTKSVITIRGGSGVIHLLPLLDKLKTQTKKNLAEICFVGFSDFSIFLNYLVQNLGSIAIHSHVANSLRLATKTEKELFFKRLSANWKGNLLAELPPDLRCLNKGSAKAKLLGGNLTSLVTLLGTKWQINFDNAILFFEDLNEPYYKIERLFAQLYYSGCLKKIKGLILGDFLYTESKKLRKLDSSKIFQIIKKMLPKDMPVLADFPSGHGAKNRPLPLGAKIFMDATKKIITLQDKRLV